MIRKLNYFFYKNMNSLIDNLIKQSSYDIIKKLEMFEYLVNAGLMPIKKEINLFRNIEFKLPIYCVIAGISAYELYIGKRTIKKVYIIGDFATNFKHLRTILPTPTYECSEYLMFDNYVIKKKSYKNLNEILYKRNSSIERIACIGDYFYYTYDFDYCVNNKIIYLYNNEYTNIHDHIILFNRIGEKEKSMSYVRKYYRFQNIDKINNFKFFVNNSHIDMVLLDGDLKFAEYFDMKLEIYQYVAKLIPDSKYNTLVNMPPLIDYIDIVYEQFEKQKSEIKNLIMNNINIGGKYRKKIRNITLDNIRQIFIILLVVLKKNNIKMGKFILFKFIELIFFFDLAKKIVNRLPRLNFTYFICFIKYNNIAFFSKIKYIFKESFSVFFKWTGYSYRF